MNNQNETKLDLVNPLNPNQVIKTEILTHNVQGTIDNEQQNNIETTNNNPNIVENNQQNDSPIETKEELITKKPKKRNNLLLIIIALLIAVALVVGVLLFLQKDKNKPNNQSNNDVTENKKDAITYEFDIKDVQDEYVAQINDKYKLNAKISNDGWASLYINDKFISDILVTTLYNFI